MTHLNDLNDSKTLEGTRNIYDYNEFVFLRSNDVTLANKMESTGKPGTVHISEKTYAFLKDDYFVQEGSPVGGGSLIYQIIFIQMRLTDLNLSNNLQAVFFLQCILWQNEISKKNFF
jgi:hypothetical protein